MGRVKVDRALGAVFKKRFEELGMTWKKFEDALEGRADIRQIRRCLSRYDKGLNVTRSGDVQDNTLDAIAKALDMEPTVFRKAIKQRRLLDEALLDEASFESLFNFAKENDAKLLPVVRHLGSSPFSEVSMHTDSGYENYLSQRSDSNYTLRERWLNSLANEEFMERVLESLPEPDIIVEIEDDWSRIVYSDGKHDPLVVQSPKLLWDCPCYSKGRQSDCPFHSKEQERQQFWVARKFIGNGYKPPKERRDLLNRRKQCNAVEKILLGEVKGKLVKFIWREMEFYWSNLENLWPPAIDSYKMVEAIESYNLNPDTGEIDRDQWRRHRKLTDIGAGVGFLGTVLSQSKKFHRVSFTDWIFMPLLFSSVNWFHNRTRKGNASSDAAVEFVIDYKVDTLCSAGTPAGVVVCNPPYLPVPQRVSELSDDFYRTYLGRTTMGTELLNSILSFAPKLGKEVFINFSNLSLQEVSAENKARLFAIGNEVKVPFRVLLEYGDYISWLREQCGLEYTPREKHAYWHTLQTYLVCSEGSSNKKVRS